VARAAVPGRLSGRLVWRVAHLVEHRDENPTARTLVVGVPGWLGHLAGQHVDVRLTADDAYSTQRSNSLAAPADGDRVMLTVQRVPDGEVSLYLTDVFSAGDPVQIRGPVGGWFVWRPTDPAPVLRVGWECGERVLGASSGRLRAATTGYEALDAAVAYAEAQPDYAAVWLDSSILNVKFTGNLERHERALRAIWGDRRRKDALTQRREGADCGRSVPARLWNCQDELPRGMTLLQVPDRVGRLAERVGPVDDGRDLAGLDQLGQG
jgi:hypothetical protein